jgi:hypothetical protein
MKQIMLLVGITYSTVLMTGCATVQREVPDIACRYQFQDVDREEDQNRVDAAIRSVAIGAVSKTGPTTAPEYRFTVARLKDLDKIHPQILYKNSKAQDPSELRQTLNARGPKFAITYDSTDISASIEVIVSFNVKPGSQLFYKDQGGSEIDVTPQVDSSGNVTLRTKIQKGQEYIFARTVLDAVTRFIRIDVYSQRVTDIDKKEY